MQTSENAYAVILAGGGGTRLWPKSRKAYPKHLLTLFGNQSMLQTTFSRILPLIPKQRVLVITSKDYVGEIQKQLPYLPLTNIIAEPQPKNTALAMGVVAGYVHKRNPEAVIVYLAADHIITEEEKFRETVTLALETAAKKEVIVSIGIQPKFAHTGLGYIKIGEEIPDMPGVYSGAGFKEKPDLATAEEFLQSGKYLWNANIYCWSTKAIFSAFQTYSPNLYSNIEHILNSIGTDSENTVLEKEYEQAENTQIDIAVSEQVDNLVVIPGDFGWNDVGDWKVIYDTKPKDEAGNVVDDVDDLLVNINSEDCLIEGNQKLIAVIGLKDIIVVDTKDALLICHKDKTQDVKKVIEKLKEDNKEEYL